MKGDSFKEKGRETPEIPGVGKLRRAAKGLTFYRRESSAACSTGNLVPVTSPGDQLPISKDTSVLLRFGGS